MRPHTAPLVWFICVAVSQFSFCALFSVLELEDNEAAVSLCLLRFASWPDEGLMLAVGTVQGLTFYPRQVDGALSCTSL